MYIPALLVARLTSNLIGQIINMKNLFFLILILISFLGACDYYDNRLQIKNNSYQAIVFDYSLDTLLKNETFDRIPYLIRDQIGPYCTVNKIIPGSTQGWPFLIQASKNQKLNVFFIIVDTLVKYNDLEYISDHKLYKRFEYSEEELENLNWVIEYP